MSNDTIRNELLNAIRELLRETFEGGLPGQGTQYLDHASGIRSTLAGIDAARASASVDGRPTIAAHARHMAFHLRVSAEWIEDDHSKRDWLGSFNPQTVSAEQWSEIQQDLERSRARFIGVIESLSLERLLEEGVGMGTIPHLAYHLGAIRQLIHRT